MTQLEQCPRCGMTLKRGFTPAHKVCSDCPNCGGRLVTLPVLKEGLGASGIAALSRAADAAPAGCRCPSCGNPMRLLKVEVEGRKVEIDVCVKCLSVWCDRGEFELLSPTRTREQPKDAFHEAAMRVSPDVRERLAKAMLEDLPEEVDPGDITLENIVRDLLYVIIGAPTLWRKVRPVSPIFSILLTVAIPIGQLLAYWSWHTQEFVRISGRHRAFWILDKGMITSGGFELHSPLISWLTYPFLQSEGYFAILLALLLFPAFAIVERKVGHAKFLILLAVTWLAAMAAHALQLALFSHGQTYLCGIAPIAVGFIAFCRVAYPDLRLRWMNSVMMSVLYLWLAVGVIFLDRFFAMIWSPAYSFALLALLAGASLGAWLGLRERQKRSPDVSAES